MLETLLENLIIMGLTILASLYYLGKKSRRIEKNISELNQLNDKQNHDTFALLENCWKYFDRAGFSGLDCDICWFGSDTSYHFGSKTNHPISFKQKLEHIDVQVTAYTSARLGENQHFEHVFWQNFVLLLRMNLLIKVNSIYHTEKQLQKYNTFILHDMKNIAQFIVMINEQLQKNQGKNQQRLLELLNTIMPGIKVRADRIIQTLSQKQASNEFETVKTTIDLASKIHSIAETHGLNIRISGNSQIVLSEEKIDQVLDNLLNNYLHHSGHHLIIHVHIEENEDTITISFHSNKRVDQRNRLRLFEPFWSSTEHGMGVGMHQCKTLLQQMNGDLNVKYLDDQTIKFVIQFKKITKKP